MMNTKTHIPAQNRIQHLAICSAMPPYFFRFLLLCIVFLTTILPNLASAQSLVAGTPPGANPFAVTVLENSSGTTFPAQTSGIVYTVSVTTPPTKGTVAVSGFDFTYTPNPNTSGTDSFYYVANNLDGISAPARVSITINPVVPTPNNVVVTVFENSINNIILPNITGIASSVSVVGDPTNGVANSTGLTITYTPTAGYLGSDSLTYSASNISGTSTSLGTVSISVVGAPPVAKQTRLEVQQNSRDNSVSANISGTANSISLVSQPTHGTATISGLNVIYTPALNYVGSDSMMYAATNTHGTSSPARILINVNEIAPIANAITATVLQDSTANVIKSNTLGTPSSIAISMMPAHGTATVSGLNIVYTPNSGFVGYDALKYTATNASGTSVAADVAITIQGIAAVANPISSTVLQDSSQNKIISSIVGNASSIAIQSQPSHGSVSVSGFNMLYTPTPGFTGVDTFSYTAVNAYGNSVSATVTVTVVGAAPIANPISVNVLQNSANNVVNSKITGTANSISISSAASHGNVQVNGLNMIYTPAAGYAGIDRFSYIASNATGNSTAAEVTITVVGVLPIANNITSSVLQDSSNNIIASNITGTAASISINGAPAHGIASVNGLNVVYTPTAGYVGTDQFSYIATNATGNSAPATVSITITGVAPSANAVTANVLQNSSNNLINSKITGTASSINIVTPPSNGSVSVSGLNLIYTPTPGFTGVDSFTYRASNTSGNSAPASVTVNVAGVVPSANNVNVSVLQNSSNNTIATNVIGTVNNIVISGAPTHGIATVNGKNILYTPTAGFVGSDKITYLASNATGNSLPADIIITVNGVAPIANAVSSNVNAGSSNNSISSNVTGNVASIALASTPSHGTASISGLNIIYTPSAAYTGTDTFTYIATNAYGNSAPATVSITVNGTAPTANAITVTVLMNSSNNLISTDTSGTVNSISLGRTPSFGTATVSGTKITYQPNVGYVGTDSFTYLANNAAGSSVPATITVTVKEAIPVANPISVNVAMNSSANTITPNIVGSASSISIVSAARNGVASTNGLQISYTPNPNYVGTDTFTYRANNAGGTSDIATVTVQVIGTAPTAATIQASVFANSSNNAIAAQTSGTVTSISIQTQPQNGSAQVNGTNILYTPTSAYVGNDVLTYLASNGAGNSAPATINITVLPVAPSASAINVNVLSGSSNNPIAPVTSGTVTGISVGAAPRSGSVSINGNIMSYTPNAGFVGQDSFSYIASNGTASAAPAIVTVTVTAATPVANPLNASVLVNSSNNVLTPTITGTSTSISLKTAATRGVAVIEGQKIIYTPNANYIGVDSFSYVANNLTSSSAPATVTVTINGVAPIARAINATVLVNSSNNPIETAITGNASSISLSSNPSRGSASIAGLVISYTPNANFVGTDSFTYIATNATGNSEPASVSIVVNEVLATANPINAVVLSNSNANSISASTTGNVTNLAIQNTPQRGSVSLSGNNFIYTPTKDFVGTDSFTYLAVNAAGNSLPATVNITVKATPPSANPVSTNINSNSGATVIRPLILGNVDRIVIAQAAKNGTATVNGLEIQYTPAANFVGTDSFSFTAINAAGTSEPVTVSIIVSAAPISLKGASLNVVAGSSTSLDLNTLIVGTGGNNATFSISKAPLHGVATITGKQLNFTAQNDFSGNDSLMLIANSNGVSSQPVAITIVISKRADPTQNRAVQAIQATKESVIRQFERLQLENFNGRLTEISSQNSALKSKEDRKKNEDACSKVSLWASGINSFSTISADYEIKNRNGGASFGGDRCIGSPDTILGFGVGYANQSGELRGMNASMSANARNVANYGQISPFPLFHFSWVLGINDINSEYTRAIDTFSAGSGMAAPPSFGLAAAPPGATQHTGKWSGKQKIGSTSVGFDINFTDFKISPYLRLDRSTISIEPYAETGDARTALRYQEQSFNSQRTTFGMNTETVVKSRFGELTPRLRFEYQRDMGKRNDVKINYLDNLDGAPYIINGSNLDRKLFHMGIGGDLLLDSGWVIILNYGYYRSNEGNSSNALRLRLSYRL